MSFPKRIITISFFLILLFNFTACGNYSSNKKQSNRIIIWTSCSEFAQYVELFNKTHKDESAVVIYKENPAISLPPAKDEPAPDIIVAPLLHTDYMQKNFKSLNYLFDHRTLQSDSFYSQLLDSGKKGHRQFLLPVSYNLPAIIFDSKNISLIPDNYTLTLDQIKTTAANYNKTNSKGDFTRIGFCPLNNQDFLYLTTKLYNVDFRSEKNNIKWNNQNLNKTINYLRTWISTENVSIKTEEDFAYKYLFMPFYRQVSTDRTLFSYTTSNVLFKILKDQHISLDYRWICQDKQIPAEDSFTMLGIYKKSKNQIGATEFISWFFQSDNQKAILERKNSLNLQTGMFGIADGFSSIRDVTERILPVFYTQLLSNLPPSQMISVPQKLPSRWESYKSYVVTQYIIEVLEADDTYSAISIEDLEKEWRKKVFD